MAVLVMYGLCPISISAHNQHRGLDKVCLSFPYRNSLADLQGWSPRAWMFSSWLLWYTVLTVTLGSTCMSAANSDFG